MRIEKDSYYDIINRLNTKAEELYVKGVIDENTKNFVNSIKLQLDKLDLDSISTYYDYSTKVLKDIFKNTEFKEIKSSIMDNETILNMNLKINDIIKDGDLYLKCIPFNIDYTSEGTSLYKIREKEIAYLIGDIISISNKTNKKLFEVIFPYEDIDNDIINKDSDK